MTTTTTALPAPVQATDEDGEVLGAEALGGDDEDEIDEEIARRRRRLMRRYKIQEVIKRRQIMLIQVVKEERGNKGAALDHLPVAGRTLLRPDAQYRSRRWYQPQDHRDQRPQAPAGRRRRPGRAPKAWA